MSFVGPPFEHDVFFSYAHADVDQVGDAETKAWCQRFAKDLRLALKRFPDFASLSLYLDKSPRAAERLDETAELTPSLRAAAGRTALLCAVMSPWYLKSEWRAKERQWWHDGARALPPPIASGFDRAFICRLMDTIEDEWPELFKDLEDIVKKGFWLYDRAKPKHERMPWGWIRSEAGNAAYKKCDGAQIVSGSNDNTVRVWDAASGEQLLVLCGHEGPVRPRGFARMARGS
jgi:hypothetical protein